MNKLTLTLALFFILALVFICFGYLKIFQPGLLANLTKPYPSTTPILSYKPTPSPSPEKAIYFDVEKAKVGDKIGGMKIIKIRGYKTDEATKDNAFVDFKGQVTVTGKYTYQPPGGYMGELLCIRDLNEQSLSKMPKLDSKDTPTSFCFNDLEGAKRQFLKNNKNEGVATVVIDNYKIAFYPSSFLDTADLIEVIEVK